MNEVLLLIFALAFLLLPKLMLRYMQPVTAFYIKAGCAVMLLAFVWLFQPDAALWPKLLITVVVADGIYRAYRSFRKLRLDAGQKQI